MAGGTIADHGAGCQVWVITLFRVITQTSAGMHAGRTDLRTLLATIRQWPQGTRRLQTTPVGRVFNGQGLEGNLREGAEAAWGG